MAKIVMWGFSSAGSIEQKNYLQELANLNSDFDFQEGNAKQISNPDNCLVLLLHDIIASLPSSIQWKVECSGGITQAKINPTNKTAGIPFSTVVENLEKFLAVTKDKAEVTRQDIELLFSIDPKLEELLTPFATFDPLAAFSTEMKSKKAELKNHVNTKLSK